jgi:recombination protein RecT
MTAQTVTSAVAKRDSGPTAVMWGKRKHFATILPASVDVEAFLGTAAGALYADDDLMKAATAHPDSLIVTLMKCAALGHMPGTDEFYLHLRKGKVTGTEGYRGVVERMYRSGAVAKVVVREVCAKDPFSFVEGVDDKPVHEIGGRGGTGASFFGADGSRNRGAMVGVYAYAQLTTGAISRVVIMDRDDVMAARESSDAKDSSYSPWNRLDGGKDHPELTGRSMWWKTAAKRLEPWVPTSAEYRREQLRASAAAASAANGGQAGFTYLPPPSMGPLPAHEIVEAEIVDEAPAAQDDTRSRSRSADAAQNGAAGKRTARKARTRAAGAAPSQGAQPPPPQDMPPLPGEDEPETPSDEGAKQEATPSDQAQDPSDRHRTLVGIVQAHFKRLGYTGDEDELRLVHTAKLAGVDGIGSTSDLDEDELSTVADTLARCRDRARLVSLLIAGEKPDGDGGG